MRIVRARPDEAAALTGIAVVAKRHWGYPERWIEEWRAALTITPELIAGGEVYVARIEDRRPGFHALNSESGNLNLQHLWVLPEAMGQGIGRSLFNHARERARELGFRHMEIESDPNAQKFYERMGARRVGSCVREVAGQRRELPILIFEIY